MLWLKIKEFWESYRIIWYHFPYTLPLFPYSSPLKDDLFYLILDFWEIPVKIAIHLAEEGF